MNLGNRGQALIEVLVAAGIVGVVGMASLSMLGTQVRETKAVAERLGGLDLERSLEALMSDGQICKLQFAGKSFAPQKDVEIQTDRIPASAAAGAPSIAKVGEAISPLAPNLIINKIYLSNIAPTGTANTFIADLLVSFDSTKLTRAMRPVRIQTGLTTVPVGGEFKIVSCSTTGAGLCTPGAKIYVGTQAGCNEGVVATDQRHWACASQYLGTLCKTQ